MIKHGYQWLSVLFIFLTACGQVTEDHKSDVAPPVFVDVTLSKKLDFSHDAGVEGKYYMPESLGSGAGLLDYDNDGDLDIYFVNGARRPDDTGRSSPPRNRLFRQDSDGTFADVTALAGVGDEGYGMGVAVGDINNDGNEDIYLSNVGPDVLFRNNGDGTFADITVDAGIDNPDWGASAAFLDVDLDGYLDLYVTNYVDYDTAFYCRDAQGRPEYCGPNAFPGVKDRLFRNNGDGTFKDVSRTSGVSAYALHGLGVAVADYNRDGYPDIYVSNDEDPNLMFINNGDGTFAEQGLVRGAALNQVGMAEAGMGIAMGDVDNDLDLDLYVTHLGGESNTLYQNTPKKGYEDVSGRAGFERADLLAYTGFGVGFLDIDNDGDLDLAVVNGRIRRGTMLADAGADPFWAPYAEPNLLFENLGMGKFTDISSTAGEFTRNVANSRGLCFGDIDNDGDIDQLVLNTGSPARIYFNDKPDKGNWLVISAIDPNLRRTAVGSEITVVSDTLELMRVVAPAYSFLCSNDSRVHFGLGEATAVTQVRVRWPGGETEVFTGTPANRFITLEKGTSTAKGNVNTF